MKKFTFFWLTGEAEVVRADDIEDAMDGFSSGVLRALDFWAEGDYYAENSPLKKWRWNAEKKTWTTTRIEQA